MVKNSHIIWASSAKRDFSNILEYLSDKWNISVANQYLIQIEKNVHFIQQTPYQFPFINNNLNIHKCVISKHNSIIYKIETNTVIILRIFDTRQNPEKISYYFE